MKIKGVAYRTIWVNDDGWSVGIIDQTRLPHDFVTTSLESWEAAAHAIKAMIVRGAPLIGATGAYGLALAMRENASDTMLDKVHAALLETRPTAINLKWALDRVRNALHNQPAVDRAALAYKVAAEICDEDVATCSAIGNHGLNIIEGLYAQAGGKRTINILTHCNAGWLACVDWGTALAPIYKAHDKGIPVHVWVDETRPRNQGASLTAWELNSHGVPHTVIVDNAGGHLMQHGRVDMCIVGTDRTTRQGDVCNKIGTYLKALAARDNDVPFYVALPHSTIDWTIRDGLREIPIEERGEDEVTIMRGRTTTGEIVPVLITPEGSKAANYGFDVTPARLVSGLVTERGTCEATEAGLVALYPEFA
ncbi:S-methyl-5-thioribose-1-phosphate isomerase [Ferrovibrio xuzhouensis]|uniref:Methylthioribose-1-phosphate isomerase n=1 Tax=Ferrovibrio xuzhouensis TaxID=1576914 RepID=A0ABV7VJA5_9PROT